jgi:hypothetical protein
VIALAPTDFGAIQTIDLVEWSHVPALAIPCVPEESGNVIVEDHRHEMATIDEAGGLEDILRIC